MFDMVQSKGRAAAFAFLILNRPLMAELLRSGRPRHLPQ